MHNTTLKAPFPWFGGKSRVADIVWERLGNVDNYIEPFFGSGAVMLGRPTEPGLEIVNDLDGFVANFWRAVKNDPEATADFADNPVFENDLHARHVWLVKQKENLAAKMEGDPEWFDAKIAGWWAWGICCWIGSGFCSGNGPWRVTDNMLNRNEPAGNEMEIEDETDGSGDGIERCRPCVHLHGNGLIAARAQRKLPALGDAGKGVNRQQIHLGNAGHGVNRKRLTGFAETGVNTNENLLAWFNDLAARFRRVRVCCGDWSRVLGPSVTFQRGLTGVFLDPPYNDDAKRTSDIYRMDDLDISNTVREWAIEQGKNPLMRIALCGYDGEHVMPASWDCVAWKAVGGYGLQGKKGIGLANSNKERIWFSPHCQTSNQGKLL